MNSSLDKDSLIKTLIKTLALTWSHTSNVDVKRIHSILAHKFTDNPVNNFCHNITLIGTGAFSNVYATFNPLDNNTYAVKKIGIDKHYKQALLEVRAMAKLNHPNIVRYYMSWIESGHLSGDDEEDLSDMVDFSDMIDFSNVNHLSNVIDFFNINQLPVPDHPVPILSMSSMGDVSSVSQSSDVDEISGMGIISDLIPYVQNPLEVIESSTSWEDSMSINSEISTNSQYNPCKFSQFICIQMELCDDTLGNFIKKNLYLDNSTKINIILQIARGIKYIHENNVLHRDLTLNNILVTLDNKIKISDFGLATTVFKPDVRMVGTCGYISPETLSSGTYSIKSDLYSFGIIILEIYMNFQSSHEKMIAIEKIKATNKGSWLSISESSTSNVLECIKSDNMAVIIRNLMSENPDNRLDIDTIIQMMS